jgi:hypothetical protein
VSRRIGLVSAVVCRPRRRHCSPCPPRKQLLAGVVRGAVAVGSGRRRHRRFWVSPSWPLASAIPPASKCSQGWGAGAGVRRLSSPSLPSMVHTHKPPYEQLLVGVVAGGESSLGGPRRCLTPLPLSFASSLLLTWPLAPAIPPASSCSQRGGGC